MASGMASGLEIWMASEMASIYSGMVIEMVSELEMSSGMLSESKLIDLAPLCQGDPRWLIGSSSPLFTILFETDVIAVPEEYWADWNYRYHYAKDYDVACLFCS
jgi:hypothetical protein